MREGQQPVPVPDDPSPQPEASGVFEPTALAPLPAPLRILARLAQQWSVPVAVALMTAATGLAAGALLLLSAAVLPSVAMPPQATFLGAAVAAAAATVPTALLVLLLMDVSRLRARLQDELAAHQRAVARLRRLAEHDELTGLLNRRAFLERAYALTALARRAHQPVSVALIDIDGFKAVNDRLGHAAGDQALREVAEALRRYARISDVLARFGGDEFVVFLPMTGLAAARQFAERLRLCIAAETSSHLTVSIGLAQAHAAEADVEALLTQADRMLYAAKQAGRNRVFPPLDADLAHGR